MASGVGSIHNRSNIGLGGVTTESNMARDGGKGGLLEECKRDLVSKAATDFKSKSDIMDTSGRTMTGRLLKSYLLREISSELSNPENSFSGVGLHSRHSVN